MDNVEADPYEQQLQAVFDGCDVDHRGSLDQAGLLQLCTNLELDQDQAEQLLRCIDKTDGRVSFLQFREGLLKLLNGSSDAKDSDCVRLSLGRGDSPEREVSPKLVLGQKKYGRRSRPESSEQDVNIEIVQKLSSDFQQSTRNGLDNSNSTIPSLPAEENIISHKSVGFTADAWPTCLEQEDALMRALLERLGVGKDGYLDQSELALVCEYIRSEKYVIEMVQQLDRPVNLEEFLSILRQCSRKESPEALTDRNPSSPASLVMVDCSGEGMASPESIVELWEAAGITQASQLLRDLGVDDGAHPLSVSSLAALLEDELRNREEGTGLLQAALALRQAELRCVRSSMEQIICERDKLRNDLAEANHRANVLAQEVDEHHAKLEKLSEEQVRLLEQKHAEALRELSKERESLAQHTSRLEREITSLQQVDAKQAAELTLLREKNENLERETRSLNEQITEVEEDRKRIERELQGKPHLLQRIRELETSREQDQVQPLLERLSILQAENSSLRDRNDELAVELEALTRRLSNVTVRRQTSTGSDLAVATKRRGNSPLELSAPEDSGEEESPRLGKVRRCSDKQQISLDAVHMEGLQINTLSAGDNSDSPDLEGDDSETLSAGSIETVCKAAETQTSEEDPPPRGPAVEKLQQQCRDLEFQLDHVKVEVMKILSEKRACSQENCILKERVSELSNRLADSADDDQQTAPCPNIELEAEKAVSAALREKVNEFEQSLELLKEEYERCEEYWAAKLEEERQIAEREQRATDEKFAELLEKVHEFEQLAAQQNSLATIEEHAGLEQEVTELQDEVRELRRLVDETEQLKKTESHKLQNEIQRLLQLIPTRPDAVANVSVQATEAEVACWNKEHTGAVNGADSYHTDSSAVSGTSCTQNDPSSSTSSSSSNSRGNRRRLCSSSGSVAEKRHRASRNRAENLKHQHKACSHLQLNLQQQRSQARSLLQNRWSHHRDELTQLEKQVALCKEQEQKLAQADILVTELYVENTRLWNTIQSMQNQLHRAMRTQEELCRR